MVATQARRLVSQACEGDDQAFSELVRTCSGTMYAAARAILRNDDDAQDCVQEAILKGWSKLGTLKQQQYFTTWITRITITTAINMTRKRKPILPLLSDVPAKGSRAEERMDIQNAIDMLDQSTRICTVLYYFEDMSVEQIAKAVGIRQGTVKSRLFRARQKLRMVLEGYDHDE